MIKTDSVNIEVLESLQIEHFKHLHIIKVKVTALKNINFNPYMIRSLNGQNIIHEIPGCNFLPSEKLKKGEEITGHIAFEKNDIATRSPVLFYDGKVFKVNKKPERVKKHG